MKLEAVRAVSMRRLLLEVFRQVYDLHRVERALLDADAASDAQLLGDVRDLRARAADFDAHLACVNLGFSREEEEEAEDEDGGGASVEEKNGGRTDGRRNRSLWEESESGLGRVGGEGDARRPPPPPPRGGRRRRRPRERCRSRRTTDEGREGRDGRNATASERDAHMGRARTDLHHRARLFALLPALLRTASIRGDDRDAIEPVRGALVALLLARGHLRAG
eukprot:31009-Pelagococcus_subviridis.AAC.4